MSDDRDIREGATELLAWAVETTREFNARDAATRSDYAVVVTPGDVLQAYSAVWSTGYREMLERLQAEAREIRDARSPAIPDHRREETEKLLRDAATERARWAESQKARDKSRPPGDNQGD